MGLSYALSSALSGLRTTQTGLELVSTNIANVGTPAYTKKTAVLDSQVIADRSAGVRITAIQREIDTYVQRQLRTETSGLSYSSVAANYLGRLQQMYGIPGGSTSLDTLVNNFTNALDSLVTTPSSQAARQSVLNEARLFTQQMNAMSSEIQSMRQEADRGLASTAERINNLLAGIEKVQLQIGTMEVTGQVAPDLLDQRDRFVNELSQLIDIRVSDNTSNFSIFTTGGVPLLTNATATKLEYTGTSAMAPQALYSQNPADSRIGTVNVVMPDGSRIDLLAAQNIRSGELKAYADLRDDILVEAQTQLDELAASIAEALSTNVTEGTASGTGFSLDLSAVQAGNKVSITYNEMPGGTERTVTFIRTDDPSALPLSDDLTADPNDRVVGIDFSGGFAAVAAQMQAALGANFSVTDAGSTLTFDAATANVDVTGATARTTATAFTNDGLAIPLFLDGNVAYTGSVDGLTQRLGFAQRITINPAILADPALLVNYQSAMTSGDATRPTFLRDALENAKIQFRTDTGLGGSSSPFTGTIADYARGLIETQARNAELAARVQEGQEIVVTSLQDRFAEKSSVNVDEEMTKLLQLQSAYAANARVISTVKEMMDVLLAM